MECLEDLILQLVVALLSVAVEILNHVLHLIKVRQGKLHKTHHNMLQNCLFAITSS